MTHPATRLRVHFIVESGTDVRLVEGLAQYFDLTVFARRIDTGVEISQPPSPPVSCSVGPSGRMAFARAVFSDLLRRRTAYDIVLVQNYGLAALAANLAAQFTGTPTLMLVCSPAELYYRCRAQHADPAKPYLAHQAFLLQLLARCNALLGQRYIVLSRHLADVVRRHGARRVHIIPVYGVDTAVFAPSSECRCQLKRNLGLPDSGTLVFFSSRIAPEKDAETLLRAVSELLDAGRDLWILHRSGGYRQFLSDAERFGVGARVIATDAVHPHHQLPLDYQACDVCVQASRAEGLGFSPLEALACETPVIASAVGGLRETIIDGETGWTYPVGDSAALARALDEVIAKPDEAHRRAHNGSVMVQRRFDRSAVFAQLNDLLTKVASSR